MSSQVKVSMGKEGLSEAKRALLEKRLRGQLIPHALQPPLTRRAVSEAPLSFAQQRLWFLHQLEPDNPFYNLGAALRLEGPLSVSALVAAINQVIQRQAILRTVISTEDGKPRQIIADTYTLDIPVRDISGAAGAHRDELLAELIADEAVIPFDIAKLPLLRATLIRLETTVHVLLVTMHHIVADGWSMGVFIRESSLAYRAITEGTAYRLPELDIQYADFAYWQRQRLAGEALNPSLIYWKQRLHAAPEWLELPTDRPRPPVQSYRGDTYRLELPETLVGRLHDLGREAGATPFMTLLAIFGLLLARYSGQTDLCIGTPVANRNRVDIEPLIGFFVNTLVLRLDLSGNPSFRAYLARVRELTLGAQTHQDLPFEVLVDELRPARDTRRNPFFQVMFALQNAAQDEFDLPGLQVTPLRVETHTALFDLSLDVLASERGLILAFEYNTDLFDRATVARLGGHFLGLAERVVADPERRLGEFPLLNPEEYRALVIDANQTANPFTWDKTFTGLFEAQARRTPELIAAECGGQRIDYRTLNQRANRIAHALIERGVGTDTLVALADERGIDLLSLILGVLKAGGGYLPLDPRHPPARVGQILRQSGVAWVVFGASCAEWVARAVAEIDDPPGLVAGSDLWTAEVPDHDPPARARPDSLAYVIYTSGSTGVPKGAMIDQRGMLNNVWSKLHWLDLQPGSVIAQTASQCFDISVWQFLSALLCGGRVCILPDAIASDPASLLGAVEEYAVDILEIVPSLLGGLLELQDWPQVSRLRWVLPTGEELPPALCRAWFARCPGVGLLNAYGPAECADDVALHPVLAAPAAEVVHMPIGRPNDNIALYVLNPCLQPQPVGVVGELYVGGIGVGRGYRHEATRTAEVFVPDPFAGEPGQRLYKSGDLARWRGDGLLEFVGRVDHQVKIRGFRVELGEIEARLLQQPQVREAVVLAREDRPGSKRLVAYVVGQHHAPDMGHLREALKAQLPEYMVPTGFVCLERLPLNANGKVDRLALPAPDLSEQLSAGYVAPRTDLETLLAGVWAEVLGLERVGIHDNFFEIGGESVIAIQVVSRVNRAGHALAPRQLFQHQTIAELAQALAQTAQPTGSEPTATAPFALAELTPDHLERLRRDHPDIEDIYPLTPMQEGMLFHTLLNPGSGIYVMQDRFLLKGPLDMAAFRTAWRRVVDEQVILRTTFLWEAHTRPHQTVHARLELPLDAYDWRDLDSVEQERRIDTLLAEELRQGFDLGTLPLFRLRLAALDEQVHLFEFSHHHSLLDDWSASLLLADFYRYYDAMAQGQSLSPRAHRPYRDYLGWLQAQDPAAAETFWRHTLRGFKAPTPLMVDRPPRALADDEIEVADIVTKLSAADSEALRVLAQAQQITPNTLVQGAWALVLSHYSGLGDVLFGVTVVGRPPQLAGMESMVGLFINGLPLRVDIVPGLPVRDWLRTIFAKNLAMREYEYSPLVQIQEWSELPRGQALFSSLITYENAPVDEVFKQGNLKFQVVDSYARVHTNYPLTLVILPGTRFSLRLSYDRRRFDAETVTRMLGHFQTLLEAMIHHPQRRVAELPWLDAQEKSQMLVDWNRTRQDYPEPRDLVARFEQQVQATPDAIAVSCGDTRLSYAELNAQANRLAHGLAAQGVGPERIVALLNDRGLEFLTMMLAVFKAGAGYLPLEPAHPNARLAQLLRESRVPFLWVGTDYRERGRAVVAACPQPPRLLQGDDGAPPTAPNPAPRHTAHNLAVVIFTSGSTGTPKGAMVEFQGMYNNLVTKIPVLGLTAADTIAQTASQCFDISVWQFLTALTCGARVAVFPDAITHDPATLLQQLAAHEVTVLEAVPSMIRALLDAADAEITLPRLRWLLPCGEVFPPELCRRWMARFPAVRLLNAYGPAECSDDVSYHPITEPPIVGEACVPVGRPVHNTRIHLLNRWLEPVPVGVAGELCVGGIQVGRGYLNRPDLTAGVFIPDPFGPPGERLYRTGDLARYRADGVLEFLGRADYQVKIRGFRIELGEIEARLAEHPGIAAVAVVVRDTPRGDKELVAYIETQPGQRLERADLRDYLKEVVPDYMVPGVFVFLDRLPITDNGKVDRKNLPVPDLAEQVAEHYVAPRDATEARLAALWGDVLGLERIGIHDSFFELGGHSLLAVKLLARIRDAFQPDIPLSLLFERPSIAAQAQALTGNGWRETPDIPLDLAAEAVLEPDIQPAPPRPVADTTAANLFLTGGTGFLGAFLIHALTTGTRHRLYCLVRAQSDSAAWTRLRAGLEHYGLWHDDLAERLIPVRGDLAQPWLGLGETAFAALAERLDRIYHSGAQVSDIAPYALLKPINVSGTRDILRLACQHHAKPLHYISTTSVFGHAPNPRPTGFAEDDIPGPDTDLRDGYDQSKWVAETLVRRAGARGLPITIYRPAFIVGHSLKGTWNTDDILCRLIKGCIELGLAPTEDTTFDLVPVDYVSRAIAWLSEQESSLGRTFHLTNPEWVSSRNIMTWLNELGHVINPVPMRDWRQAVVAAAKNSTEFALYPLASLFEQADATHDEPAEHTFDCRKTLQALAAGDITCPGIDKTRLANYFDYFYNTGFINKP